MKLLKWVTHPVTLLAVIIIAAAAFVDRDALFRQPIAASGTSRQSSKETAARASKNASATGEGSAAMRPPETADPLSTWREARLTAWRGELEHSVQLYHQLAKLDTKSIDAYGEMGNVLMRMGDWDGAADAYYRAALRAKAQGQERTAWYLHSVVAGLDPDRAAKLRGELSKQ